MKDRSKEEILKERKKAINLLMINNYNVEILDSYFEDYNPQGGSVPLKYLAKSIEILADADVLLCIGDWENYRGCRIEHECAKQYGIKIIYWSK
jgi:hypothetical protein